MTKLKTFKDFTTFDINGDINKENKDFIGYMTIKEEAIKLFENLQSPETIYP